MTEYAGHADFIDKTIRLPWHRWLLSVEAKDDFRTKRILCYNVDWINEFHRHCKIGKIRMKGKA